MILFKMDHVFLILYCNFTGKKFPWLTTSEICPYKSTDDVFIELQATAMLCQPSGECLCPDATLCTALSSALYSSICEEDVFKRHLTVCSFLIHLLMIFRRLVFLRISNCTFIIM